MRDRFAAQRNAQVAAVEAEEVLEFVVGDVWCCRAVDVECEAGEDLGV